MTSLRLAFQHDKKDPHHVCPFIIAIPPSDSRRRETGERVILHARQIPKPEAHAVRLLLSPLSLSHSLPSLRSNLY